MYTNLNINRIYICTCKFTLVHYHNNWRTINFDPYTEVDKYVITYVCYFQTPVKRNGSTSSDIQRQPITIKRAFSSSVRTVSEEECTGSKKERKASAGSRFTIYKVNKASRKKREKSSAKKERKATKTLAIVLGKLHLWPNKV